jgi:hypothetical protein
LYPRNFTA